MTFSALLLATALAVSPVRAAMVKLCGARGAAISQQIETAATKENIDPLLLGAVITSESSCNPRANNGKGDYGLGQIREGGSAAKGRKKRALFNVKLNIKLTAQHIRKCLTLCDEKVPGALGIYRGHKKCSSKAARKGNDRTLKLYEKAKKAAIESQKTTPEQQQEN